MQSEELQSEDRYSETEHMPDETGSALVTVIRLNSSLVGPTIYLRDPTTHVCPAALSLQQLVSTDITQSEARAGT